MTRKKKTRKKATHKNATPNKKTRKKATRKKVVLSVLRPAAGRHCRAAARVVARHVVTRRRAVAAGTARLGERDRQRIVGVDLVERDRAV